MNKCLGLMVAVAALAVTACSSVKLKAPFPPPAEPADKARLEGAWQVGDAVVYLNFRTNGVAEFHVPGWENGRFQVTHGELVTATGDGQGYFCARVTTGDEASDVYDLAAFRLVDDDQLVFWWPKPDSFKQAVASGTLEGGETAVNHGKHIILSSPPEKLLRFLTDPANKDLFQYTSPIVARKVAPGPR